MKKQAIRSFTILGLLLVMSAVSVRAQSQRNEVTKIPFSFIVGDKTLPAGAYRIEPNSRNYDKVWLVQSSDGDASALFSTIPTRSFETQEKSKLVFRKYGDQYFLAEVWTESNGLILAETPAEKEMRASAGTSKYTTMAVLLHAIP